MREQPNDDAALLRLLVDERDIRGLLDRYCRALDRCDEALLRSLYHEDAIIEHGPFRGDPRQFCTFVVAKMLDIAAASHHITNVLIDIDGDRALSESSFINVASEPSRVTAADIPYDRLLTGRYLDRLEKRAGVWKISGRLVVYDTVQLLPPTGPHDDPRYAAFHPRGAQSPLDPSSRFSHALSQRRQAGELE